MAPGADLPHPDREVIELSDVLFALSDPDRLDLARQLRYGPMSAAACNPADQTLPKSTKSHLLKVLRESGVIVNEPDGRSRRLTLRRDDLDHRFPGLLDAILDAEQPKRSGD